MPLEELALKPVERPDVCEVLLIGPGRVGATLLKQIQDLQSNGNLLNLKLVAIARRSGVVHDSEGISVADWQAGCFDATERIPVYSFHRLFSRIAGKRIIIDATADPAFADYYAQWLIAGIHVITANKEAGGGCCDRFKRILEAQKLGKSRWYFETTVGAGLPVINSIRQLLRSGDQVEKVRGVLSGTLSWLLKCYEPGDSFSALITQAHRLGLTEPNPLIDLSGEDVARKAIILAREIGLIGSHESIDLEPVIALEPTQQQFPFNELTAKRIDRQMAEALEKAHANHKALAYIADISSKGIRVGLQQVDQDSPFAAARPGDNIIEVTSKRYTDNPLVIQGPGAGLEVTAGGLLAELVELSAH